MGLLRFIAPIETKEDCMEKLGSIWGGIAMVDQTSENR